MLDCISQGRIDKSSYWKMSPSSEPQTYKGCCFLIWPAWANWLSLCFLLIVSSCLVIVFISSDLGWNTLAGGKHTYYRSGSSCPACVPCVKLPTVHRLQLHLRLSQRKYKTTKPNTLQIPSQNTNKIQTNCRGVHCRRQQHKPQKWKSENPVTPLANWGGWSASHPQPFPVTAISTLALFANIFLWSILMLFLQTDLSLALMQIWSWEGVLHWRSSQSRATLPPPAWMLHTELRLKSQGGLWSWPGYKCWLGKCLTCDAAEQNHCKLLTSHPKPSQQTDLSALLYVDGWRSLFAMGWFSLK